MIAEDELELPEADLSTGLEMAQRLVRMRHAIDLQELAFCKVAAEFAATNYYDHDARTINAVDWIRHNCHMTSNAVADRVSVGQRMGDLVRSVAQVAIGEIGFAHLVVMARTAKAVGEDFEEGPLLEQARKCTPGKLYHKSLHYRHAVQPEAYAREQAGQAESNRLSLSTCEDGSLLLNAELDSVGGAVVRSALELLARKHGRDDHRLRDQRLADALVELATHVARMQRPASWSDGHHLVHWIHGGSTDLDNLALLCGWHHRKVHEGDWQLAKTDEGRIVPIPPAVSFGHVARGPD